MHSFNSVIHKFTNLASPLCLQFARREAGCYEKFRVFSATPRNSLFEFYSKFFERAHATTIITAATLPSIFRDSTGHFSRDIRVAFIPRHRDGDASSSTASQARALIARSRHPLSGPYELTWPVPAGARRFKGAGGKEQGAWRVPRRGKPVSRSQSAVAFALDGELRSNGFVPVLCFARVVATK